MSDFQKIAWHNLIQKPILDRIFYVPFWECPHQCDFCCVDSKPGKPPQEPTQSEPKLLELMDALYARTQSSLQVHIYGGEPLLRPDIIASLAGKLREKKSFKKLYLYTTLRHEGAEQIVQAIGAENLRIIVNKETTDSKAQTRIENLKGIAEMYRNVTFFPTGRGKEGTTGHKKGWLEKLPLASMPGKSCFANASGMLINGPHETVHLCCLPQSPVIGTTHQTATSIIDQYLSDLKTWHKGILSTMKEKNLSHACSVCEESSQWNPKIRPTPSHLTFEDNMIPTKRLHSKPKHAPTVLQKSERPI